VSTRTGSLGRWGRTRAQARARLRSVDAAANRTLHVLAALAALLVVVTILEIAHQVLSNSSTAISQLGLGFVFHTTWQPNFNHFGAGAMLYGTLVSSAMALVLAAPIGISIGLFLGMLAPRRVASAIGPMVEMLAAVPSVIIGFWGLVILAPFVQQTVEPFLHGAFGFIGIFGTPQTTGLSIFTAGLVLTIMIVPIIAALSRDLFRTVPKELKDGAEALGATRWEVIRGVVLPTTIPGVLAASMLALGRALGEAIAVAQVIGGGSSIHTSLFQPASTLASRIALTFTDAVNKLHTSSLFYLATILFVIGIATNLLAQRIAGRYGHQTAL
jgi:phosphate transport system permease protein